MDESTMKILENSLRRGNVMHAFLSGGGLRVVRLEKGRHGKLVGYGEHPCVNEALRHAAEDFEAGGREYADVYGKIYPHYLTGSSAPDGELDEWIRAGRTFDCRVEGKEFIAELIGMEQTRLPEVVEARAKLGETVRWKARGYTFESCPSGIGISTTILESLKGDPQLRAWMYYVKKTGRSTSLQEALDSALVATPAEIPDPS